jgi:hypothetical protein
MNELFLYGGIGLGVVVFLIIIIIVIRQRQKKSNINSTITFRERMYTPQKRKIQTPSANTDISSIPYPKIVNGKILDNNQTNKNLEDILENIKSLQEIYYEDYRFPDWNKNKNVFKFVYPRLAKKTMVYYDESEIYEENNALEKSVLFREPCNIAMETNYSKEKLKQKFGWEVGYYIEYYNKYKSLAPNFGIYCKTPVAYKKNPTHIEKLEDLEKNIVHVYNAIGYAFDDINQPDYKYFIEQNKQEELIPRYSKIFELIIKCATDNNLNTIIMSAVGANNFATNYENDGGKGKDYFQRTIWVPAFLMVFKKIKEIKNIDIKFMGINRERVIVDELKYNDFEVKDIGNFPLNIGQVDKENTLFVNAWDPFSIVGNGNFRDGTMDGWIGRSTFAAPLTFPPTNPFMRIRKDGLVGGKVNPKKTISIQRKLNEQQAFTKSVFSLST